MGTSSLAGKKALGCRWVYTVKLNPDGTFARLKTRLAAKRYSQTYGVDCPLAKMALVQLLIPLIATDQWTLQQIDIKNAFLHGILDEKVYMECPSEFVAQV